MTGLPPKAPPKRRSHQTHTQPPTPIPSTNPSTANSSINSSSPLRDDSPEDHSEDLLPVPRASKYDVLLKYLLIGDSYSGKTTLLHRFCEDEFVPQFNMTIGIDFKMKIIRVGHSRVKLQIWDSAGDERYAGQSSMFYREVAVVFYCYDVSDKRTFNRMDHWIDCIDATVQTKDLIQVLVACKCDTPPSHRQVSRDEGQTLAINKKFYYYETDAKAGTGISELFSDVTEKVLGRRERNRFSDESSSSFGEETRESSLEPPPRRRGASEGALLDEVDEGSNNPFANRRGKAASKSFREWSRKSSRNLRSSFRKSFVKSINEPEGNTKEDSSACKVS